MISRSAKVKNAERFSSRNSHSRNLFQLIRTCTSRDMLVFEKAELLENACVFSVCVFDGYKWGKSN